MTTNYVDELLTKATKQTIEEVMRHYSDRYNDGAIHKLLERGIGKRVAEFTPDQYSEIEIISKEIGTDICVTAEFKTDDDRRVVVTHSAEDVLKSPTITINWGGTTMTMAPDGGVEFSATDCTVESTVNKYLKEWAKVINVESTPSGINWYDMQYVDATTVATTLAEATGEQLATMAQQIGISSRDVFGSGFKTDEGCGSGGYEEISKPWVVRVKPDEGCDSEIDHSKPWNAPAGFNRGTAAYDPTLRTEDFIFPRPSEGRGSRVETLHGGPESDDFADLEYFRTKVLTGLKLPEHLMERAIASIGYHNPDNTGCHDGLDSDAEVDESIDEVKSERFLF